jgi:hypothetical protein
VERPEVGVIVEVEVEVKGPLRKLFVEGGEGMKGLTVERGDGL